MGARASGTTSGRERFAGLVPSPIGILGNSLWPRIVPAGTTSVPRLLDATASKLGRVALAFGPTPARGLRQLALRPERCLDVRLQLTAELASHGSGLKPMEYQSAHRRQKPHVR